MPRGSIGGLVLFLDKMQMELHGSQEKEITYILNISSLKKSDLPNSPGYVPSVYPKTIAKSLLVVLPVLVCSVTQLQ